MVDNWVRTGKKDRGVGEVRQGNQLLAKVQYDLAEEQGYFIVEEMRRREPLQGDSGKRIRGTITVVEGEQYLDKYDSLALHLKDGRVKQAIIESRLRWDSLTYRVIIRETE